MHFPGIDQLAVWLRKSLPLLWILEVEPTPRILRLGGELAGLQPPEFHGNISESCVLMSAHLLLQCSGLGVFLSGRRLFPGGCKLLRRKYLLGKQYYLQVKSVPLLTTSVHLGCACLPHWWPQAQSESQVIGPCGSPGTQHTWVQAKSGWCPWVSQVTTSLADAHDFGFWPEMQCVDTLIWELVVYYPVKCFHPGLR